MNLIKSIPRCRNQTNNAKLEIQAHNNKEIVVFHRMSLLTWEDMEAATAAKINSVELAIKPQNGKMNLQGNNTEKTQHDTSASNITSAELGRLNKA